MQYLPVTGYTDKRDKNEIQKMHCMRDGAVKWTLSAPGRIGHNWCTRLGMWCSKAMQVKGITKIY